MRTNIDIDDRLMAQAMRRSGARTKKAAVEAGLRLLAQTHAHYDVRFQADDGRGVESDGAGARTKESRDRSER